MRSPAAVYVCVPARNEAVLLPAFFKAVSAQTASAGRWSLCLLLDGCTDSSHRLAETFAKRAAVPVAIRETAAGPPNAGLARAAALRMAVEHARGAPALFLTTDADSTPAPDWIASARVSLNTCDVATGRLVRASGSPRQDRLEAYYDRLYALRRRLDPVPWDPGPHHHFTGGANMAFRSEAYLRVGGFAPRASGEDALIVDEAQRAGLRVRRDASMVVRTSSRRSGRAPGGLAAALRAGGGIDQVQVAHPNAMAWQYAAHALARAYFQHPSPIGLAALARRLSLSPEQVEAVAAASPNAEGFATCVTPAPPDRRIVPLSQAEIALAALERAPALDRAA